MTVLTVENAIKELMAISQHLTEEDAQTIKTIWFDVQDYDALEQAYPTVLDIERGLHQPRLINRRALWNLKCYCINRILETFGLEYLGQDLENSVEITYCAPGDDYCATVFFIRHGTVSHLEVSTVADMYRTRRVQSLSELGGLL